MEVLVQAAHHENLLVVSDGLGSEEFFRLLERALVQTLDFVGLCVEVEAVAYPAVVATEDEDLAVIESEGAQSVPRRPHVVLVDVLELLPLLLVEIQEAIKSLNGFEWSLIHAVSSSDHVNIPSIKHGHSVVVSWLLQIANISPLVFRDIVHLALLGGLIWIFRADGVNEIFGLEVELPVKVGQLVARSGTAHEGSLLHLVGLLVDHIALIREH